MLFREDFADAALPGWRGARPSALKLSRTQGPGGIPALTMETREPVSGALSVSLPVERIAGKAVLLEVWRKTENVKTGARHYYNAKSMLSWKAKSEAKPEYSSTAYSDFSGTFDWEKHCYVMGMPEDLERASVTIGMQACTGKASWAGLTVCVDPRFPSQHALERFLAREERQTFANLDADTLVIKRLSGGIVQVFAGHKYVPRKYWNDVVRRTVLAPVQRPTRVTTARADGFRRELSQAMKTRASELEAGLTGLKRNALNDRVCEIASLRERVRQIWTEAAEEKQVRLKADAESESPVSPLIFGNNINTQNLTAPYDSARGKFQDEFLTRVRPMRITFLRYPGGCNADVFNWKDTIGPLRQRKDIINYHNGTSRGIAKCGVDEYLRFCEEESMVPIITTAFCKDRPESVDPNDHPNGIRHKFIFSYLKTAPERVQLAADWVEYCNGSVNTPFGKLRAKNGHPKPYRVRYWEIGNESYGPDPTGSCEPEEYANAFPKYVKAMKARDPSISIVMNGCSRKDWNEPLLRIAGEWADAFQFHIYRTPRVNNYSKLEGRPHQVTTGMRLADNIPGLLSDVAAMMKKHLGRTLPIIISEFGMGNARNREFMTSVTSAVLVADMWRTLLESPVVLGANKWCLFTGYWFSQIQGPTLHNPNAPYYNRPEWAMHVIYARCRSKTRLAVNNEVSEGAKAIVFKHPNSYGVVLISREAAGWQSVVLDLPGAKRGRATCILLTAGHPFLGNENDHSLIGKYEFEFDYAPGEPITVPSSSVMGLIVPR
ncbi:MAG: hypothetical protein ISS72_02280 [Candidatus Brocadiae bacterium]|nr:hypothetical protein [Candidatus Brocadiia bacterium]